MQIRSTQRQTAPYPLPKLTPKGELDRQLAAGIADTVELGAVRTESGKNQVSRDFLFTALHHGVLGGGLGLAMGNMSPLGGLAGLGLGTYVAWNKTARKTTGSVTVNLDGESRKTRYYGRPENYLKTPQEVRAEMIARGELGERIRPFTPEPSALSTEPLNWSAQEQNALQKFAKERRLVADFGQESEYGHEVINQVDSLTAARLLREGRDVYLVDGRASDVKHTLDVVAHNSRSTVRRHDSDEYLERTYDYSLQPVTRETVLSLKPEGQGLPEGFHGIYKNSQNCSLVMGEDEQAGLGIVDKDYRHTSFNNRRVSRDQSIEFGAGDKARVVTTFSVNVRDLVTMGGVLAGMLTGMGVAPGVPHAVLLGGAVGGVLGREVGWLAQDRMPSYQAR